MPTVHPLFRGRPFTLSDTELTDDELCDYFNMPSLSTTAIRAANIHDKAELLGFEIGSDKDCSSSSPCGRFACLRCRRMKQEDYVMLHAPLFINEAWRQLPGLEQAEWAWAITIAPAALRFPNLDHSVSLEEAGRWFRNLFKDYAPEVKGFFGFDFSWNEPEDGREGYWQVHLHGVIWNLSRKAKRQLRKVLKKGADEGDRPLKVTRLRTPARWLAYISKSNFQRRISVIGKDGERDTKDEALLLSQEVELALWLSLHKVNKRFFTIGLGRNFNASLMALYREDIIMNGYNKLI